METTISPIRRTNILRYFGAIITISFAVLGLVLSENIGLVASQTGQVDSSDDTFGDYPLLSDIPDTEFECTGRMPGYYADDHPISSCQVFHYCHHDGRVFDFLCPNSTIFNQKVFACDHFYNFECNAAKEYYYLNELFLNGTIPEDSE